MKNGYFKLVNAPGGFGVHIFPPQEGGEEIRLIELINYLDGECIEYNLQKLKEAVASGQDTVLFLGNKECPVCAETYSLSIADDLMSATVRFYPASDTGKRMSFDEFFKDMHYRNVKSGIQVQTLQEHFQSEGIYCTDIIAAKGREPRHGTDAKIEYYFNTDVHAKPEMKEDGSVDYFNLNVINRCKKGDVLARIIPEDAGDFGINIAGNRIKPRDVKKAVFKYGKNISLSEDRLTISSMVDGHVMLTDNDVFVSDVYTVENVDTSTGNIDFTGSVQVNGNVATNYVVKAGGDVVINGVVEGAHIEAGGNIIIARGMNGMSKGTLKAGGNIVAKFLENATAEAEGYVSTESSLHSNITAGTEVIVSGRRGFITVGRVQASDRIEAKTIGAVMGAATLIEVGVNPKLKERFVLLQKEISDIVTDIKSAQPIIANFAAKKAKGVKFTDEQLKYVKNVAVKLEADKKELEDKNNEIKDLQQFFDPKKKAVVVVSGEVYPGTTITINDVSMTVQNSYKFCRFEKVSGDVKMLPL
ncbi:MAG: FapA family protein [Lachnospiraceae bacterium]|nr:FapA family protein [Lachnospiraceae bacterium]